MSIRKKQDQDGVALILAIFSLLLFSAIAMAMVFSSDTETSISVNYRGKQSAIYGALAGLQEARDRIHPLTGDLGVGSNLSAGGSNIVPTALPSTSAPNVLYLLNPASGETVAPWNPSNKYFDTELCHESYFVNNLGVTPVAAGTPCPATSASVPSGNSWYAWYDNSQKKTNTAATGIGNAVTLETAYQLKDSNGNKIPLTYKWVRITLKSDNMTPVSVGTGNGTQVCWDGSHEQQLPVGYHTDCTPISGGITHIAVTASGSGYTSAPSLTISGGSGAGATATAVVGQLPAGLSSVTLTNPGAGYTSVPTVTITPTDGQGGGANVTATNGAGSGFAGTVTSASNKKADGAYVPSNPGSDTTVPTTFSVASPCASVTITPTYGIQMNTVNVTAGGAYATGSPPSVTFGGATPIGGAPSGMATLSGSVTPGPVTGLSIPFGGTGSGYDAKPILSIAPPACIPGPGCVQATGTASIATNEGVLSINITNPGTGYSQANPPRDSSGKSPL